MYTTFYTQPAQLKNLSIQINLNELKNIFDKSSLYVLPDINLFTYTRFLQGLRLFKTNKQMTRGGSYELPEYNLHCMTWLVNLSFGNFFYGWINCLIILSIYCTVYMILWGKICPLGVVWFFKTIFVPGSFCKWRSRFLTVVFTVITRMRGSSALILFHLRFG